MFTLETVPRAYEQCKLLWQHIDHFYFEDVELGAWDTLPTYQAEKKQKNFMGSMHERVFEEFWDDSCSETKHMQFFPSYVTKLYYEVKELSGENITNEEHPLCQLIVAASKESLMVKAGWVTNELARWFVEILKKSLETRYPDLVYSILAEEKNLLYQLLKALDSYNFFHGEIKTEEQYKQRILPCLRFWINNRLNVNHYKILHDQVTYVQKDKQMLTDIENLFCYVRGDWAESKYWILKNETDDPQKSIQLLLTWLKIELEATIGHTG